MASLNKDLEPDSPFGEGHSGGFRRMLGAGEDPLGWSFPVARLGALRLRAHWILPVFVASELVAWLPRNSVGLQYVLGGIASLLALVVVREIARGGCALLLGGVVDHVTMWPLGGLNSVAALGSRHPLASEFGGLGAGVILVPVLAGAVLGTGVDAPSLLFNPFAPGTVLTGLHSQAQVFAWWCYYMNLVLLAMNALAPMLPFDCGRILTAYLRERRGQHDALGGRIGIIAVGAIFVLAAAVGETRLMAVAVFSGLATYLSIRRAQFLAPQPITSGSPAEDSVEQSDQFTPPQAPPRLSLDAVLAKISRDGIASLTPAERELLSRETQRRRRG